MMQFLVYWALLTSGPLSLDVGLSVVISRVQLVGGSEQLRVITAISFIMVLLWDLYHFVPNCFVPANHTLASAAVTTFCLETTRFLFAWYTGNFDGYKSIYGAFATVPFLLLWLNLLWTLVLGGAVLTSSLSYWCGEALRRSLDARGHLDDVLKVLLLLDSAQRNNKALPVQEFGRHISMDFDESSEFLEKLARYGCVHSDRQGQVLGTGTESVDLVELFRLFVYRPQTFNKDKINQTVDRIMQPCLETLSIVLAEFGAHTKKQSS